MNRNAIFTDPWRCEISELQAWLFLFICIKHDPWHVSHKYQLNWNKRYCSKGNVLVLFRTVERNTISAQVLVGLSACCRRIIGCRTKNVAVDIHSHTTDERGQPVLSPSWSHLHRRVLGTTDVCLAQGTHCNTDMPAIYRSLCLGLPC